MKIISINLRLLFGIIIAHALLFFSFHDDSVFWYIFSGSILVLIMFAIYQESMENQLPITQYLLTGIVSGVLLYVLFWIGRQIFGIFPSFFVSDIQNMYRWFAPSDYWQYLALIVIAAPGEELFWRGFVQTSLLKSFKPATSIIGASLLYASVNIYSGSILLVFASFISGLIWGFLYIWRKSMPLVIVSHIVFDIMIFIIWPLK